MTKESFIRYQSLHNRFILFDWRQKSNIFIEKILSDKNWPVTVRNLCAMNGNLDGVLVLTNYNGQFHVKVFNSNGSDGQVCLNGARCVAHYLYNEGHEGKLALFMGGMVVESKLSPSPAGRPFETISLRRRQGYGAQARSLRASGLNLKPKLNEIIQYINLGRCEGKQTIDTPAGTFAGHVVDVGNPHFIVFEKQTREWLEKNGKYLSKHQNFPDQINIEFVWPDKLEKNKYNVLVYERGCGVTQACSSGAAAITNILFKQNKIKIDKKIILQMMGGSLQTWVTKEKKIALRADKPPAVL
ncbi:hypothetical protein KAT92_03000 [Candidatus Babeliales bacterium]|nr:hypothetical protein [Candidatus Babeliales bacterium]